MSATQTHAPKRMTLAQAAAQIESLRAQLTQERLTSAGLRVRLNHLEHSQQEQRQRRAGFQGLSERAKAYCAAHGVRSVTREQLLAWRP